MHPSASFPTITPGTFFEALLDPADETEAPAPIQTHTAHYPFDWDANKANPFSVPRAHMEHLCGWGWHIWSACLSRPQACSILWGPTSFSLVPSPSHLHCLSHLLSGMCSGRVYLCSEAESSRIKSSHTGPILAHTCIHTQRHTHSPGYPHSHLYHYTHILALVDHMHTHRLVPKINTHLSRPKYIRLLPKPICEVSFLGGPIFVEVEEIRKHRNWM